MESDLESFIRYIKFQNEILTYKHIYTIFLLANLHICKIRKVNLLGLFIYEVEGLINQRHIN